MNHFQHITLVRFIQLKVSDKKFIVISLCYLKRERFSEDSTWNGLIVFNEYHPA